jgi:cytochrome c oxidase assembly protein subunit 15
MIQISESDRPAFLGLGKLLTAASFLSFGLIVLGSSVRATDSGLSCPDWPLCFGKAVPHFDLNIFLEWFHRLCALALGFIMIAAIVKFVKNKSLRQALGKQIAAASVLLLIQIVLGGLTVLHLLDPKIVNAHLSNAMLFFTVLLWMAFRARLLGGDIRIHPDATVSPALRKIFYGTTIALFLQIGLGGMVSSNYAGLACPDFPTCHGEWLPALHFPVVIQMLHRGIAFVLLAVGVGLSLKVGKLDLPPFSRLAARMLPALIALQILLGMVNVFMKLPVWASVAHLGNAALIFALMVLGSIELAQVRATKRDDTRTALRARAMPA